MALERPTYTRPSVAKRTLGAMRSTSRRVVAVSVEGLGVGLAGAAVSADLGGSSKYSSENLED